MDPKLESYLKKYNINYVKYDHPAVFTVQESNNVNLNLKCLHAKSLFLKDEKGRFYLVCMEANKRLDMKFLQKHLNVSKLRFASPEELKKELKLTPGSVSIFGMIYPQNVKLIIDKTVWEADTVGFHPNINTSTLEIDHENLEKFLDSLNCIKDTILL